MEENIQVAVRIRPLSQKEQERRRVEVWEVNDEEHSVSSALHLLRSRPAAPPPPETDGTSGSRRGAAITTPVSGSGATVARPLPSRSGQRTPNSSSRSSASSSRTGRTRTTPQPLPLVSPAVANRVYKYQFDAVFEGDTSTQEVYDRMAESIVWSCMDGFNGTIFAYGQTGSGKTYTIKGLRRNPGIIPLTVEDLFTYIRKTPEREFLLRVSYFELYNEVINDLLNPLNGTNLQIRENKKRGIFIENLREEVVVSPEQVLSLLRAGESHRHVGSTNFNEASSRSHTIFRVIIESKERRDDDSDMSDVAERRRLAASVRKSVLSVIDLAGSEKFDKSEDAQKLRQKEGAFINKSLLTLGNVISKLGSKKKSKSSGHIPYRDSKLTRLLEPSLRGNARVSIVCTISPSDSCFEESHNTLKFANRAKRITNKAKLNEVVDDQALIQQYRSEINRLKQRLNAAKGAEERLKQFDELRSEKQRLEEYTEMMVQRLHEQDAEKNALEQKIDRLNKLILVSSSVSTPSHRSVRRHRGPTARKKRSTSALRGSAPPERDLNGSTGSSTADDSKSDSVQNSGDEPPASARLDQESGLFILDSDNEGDSDAESATGAAEGEGRYNAELVASLMRNIQALNKSLAAAKKMAARRAKEVETLEGQLVKKDEFIERLLNTTATQAGAAQRIEELAGEFYREQQTEEQRGLRSAVVDRQLEIEVQMADNAYLVQLLRQKDAQLEGQRGSHGEQEVVDRNG